MVAILAGAMISCSIEKNYKTLSFFFDGVPDPAAKARATRGGGGVVDIKSSPTYSVHKPFKEEACAECHTKRFKLGGQDSALCLKCHEAKTSEHERMHGPVVAVACLWCHTPHESAEAHLMKKPARQVCSQCHEPGVLSSERVAAHADNNRSCLECHFGHGGKAAYFLRPGVNAVGQPPPAPPTAPTPDAAAPAAAPPATPPQK
jgi:predicted CXXCH cytochrome family protein